MSHTPEQFNKLVTKDYLDEKLKSYVGEDKFNEKFDKVFSVLDTIVKKLDNLEAENVANIEAQ